MKFTERFGPAFSRPAMQRYQETRELAENNIALQEGCPCFSLMKS